VPVRESLALPVTEPVSARLTFPQQEIQAGLQLLDLTVPFEAVTLAPRRPVTAARPPVPAPAPARPASR
jgi:hypothetical protein